MATKAPAKKKPVAKKPVAKKAPAKKAPVKKVAAKKPAVRSASASRRPMISRSDEFSQLTWILFCIWFVLIAIFLGTVIGKIG